jgi:hypothetical protein
MFWSQDQEIKLSSSGKLLVKNKTDSMVSHTDQ